MKIRIEFSNREKETIMQVASTVGPVQPDKDEHVIGNFGEFRYDSSDNEMVYDLKPDFIIATSQMLAACANMLKSVVSTYKMYESFWLKGAKDLTKEDEPSNNPYMDELKDSCKE